MQPVNHKHKTLFGQSLTDAEKLLGMGLFQEKYAKTETDFAQKDDH